MLFGKAGIFPDFHALRQTDRRSFDASLGNPRNLRKRIAKIRKAHRLPSGMLRSRYATEARGGSSAFGSFLQLKEIRHMTTRNQQSLSIGAPLQGDVSLPWTLWNQWFPITINSMASSDPAKETHIVQNVASYGKQLGRIVEVISVLLDEKKPAARSKNDQKVIDAFTELADEIAAAKAGVAAPTPENLNGLIGAVRHWKNQDRQQYEALRKVLLEELRNSD